MLKNLLDLHFDGWVIFLDADAFIKDMQFDIYSYLKSKKEKAAIFSGYIDGVAEDINSGGFAINYSHPIGRLIVKLYWEKFSYINFDKFDEAIFWEEDIKNDQLILREVLEYITQKGLKEHVEYEDWRETYVNDGPFIEQALRSHFPSGFDARVEYIKDRTNEIIGLEDETNYHVKNIIDMHTSHPRLFSKNKIDTLSIIELYDQDGGCIMHGPYIKIPPGGYISTIKLYSMKNFDSENIIKVDVCSNNGDSIIKELYFSKICAGYNAICVDFVIDREDDLEIRLYNYGVCNAYVHGLSIERI